MSTGTFEKLKRDFYILPIKTVLKMVKVVEIVLCLVVLMSSGTLYNCVRETAPETVITAETVTEAVTEAVTAAVTEAVAEAGTTKQKDASLREFLLVVSSINGLLYTGLTAIFYTPRSRPRTRDVEDIDSILIMVNIMMNLTVVFFFSLAGVACVVEGIVNESAATVFSVIFPLIIILVYFYDATLLADVIIKAEDRYDYDRPQNDVSSNSVFTVFKVTRQRRELEQLSNDNARRTRRRNRASTSSGLIEKNTVNDNESDGKLETVALTDSKQEASDEKDKKAAECENVEEDDKKSNNEDKENASETPFVKESGTKSPETEPNLEIEGDFVVVVAK